MVCFSFFFDISFPYRESLTSRALVLPFEPESKDWSQIFFLARVLRRIGADGRKERAQEIAAIHWKVLQTHLS
jgi:hypothetical protein